VEEVKLILAIIAVTGRKLIRSFYKQLHDILGKTFLSRIVRIGHSRNNTVHAGRYHCTLNLNTHFYYTVA
jgi:hypothetical protein